MLARVNAVLIDSPDGPRLAEFYRDQLGVPVEEERHGSEPHWGCFLDDVHFAIHHVPDLPATTRPAVAISFETDDVDAVVASLREAGVVIESEPEDRPFGRLASLRDPDGNLIYLHKYPN